MILWVGNLGWVQLEGFLAGVSSAEPAPKSAQQGSQLGGQQDDSCLQPLRVPTQRVDARQPLQIQAQNRDTTT